jgi:hypothetical protein
MMSIVHSFIPRFSTYFLSSGLSPCVMERTQTRQSNWHDLNNPVKEKSL